jgi:hypothetical protein
MNLLNDVETRNFIEKIKYPRKGIMFDISHFILINNKIKNYKDVEEFIQTKIISSTILKKYIKGIHLNSTFPMEYIEKKLKENEKKLSLIIDKKDRYKIVMDHITSLDSHNIYADYSIKKIMENLDIEYLVFEFKWNSQIELISKIKEQNKFLL